MPPTTTPLWLDLFEKLTPALFTLILGVVASGIAYFQYRINRDKLRLDLFEKRLAAYEKLQDFYGMVLREGCVNGTMIPVLWEARSKSRFLFGPEIEAGFATHWWNASEMMTLRIQLYGEDALPKGDARTAVVQKESDLLRWLMDQMKGAPDRYSKYLHFK